MHLSMFSVSCFVVCMGVAAISCAPQGYSYPDAHNQLNDYPAENAEPSQDYLQDLQTVMAAQEQLTQGQGYLGPHDAPIVTKRFFVHSAPEDTDDEPARETHVSLGKSRLNYNVVFIRAPAKPAGKTTVRITPAINEDKTVIYVLAKKPEEHHIETHVQEPATTTAKPEVFFIKYNTAAEAEHAQANIQAQYDHLGGSSVVSHEGVPAVHSVVGSLGDDARDEVSGGSQYLPPRRY